jgi:hypothetical protein
MPNFFAAPFRDIPASTAAMASVSFSFVYFLGKDLDERLGCLLLITRAGIFWKGKI